MKFPPFLLGLLLCSIPIPLQAEATLTSLPPQEFLPRGTDDYRPVVSIPDGTLKGFTLRTIRGRAISAFQSIPYAEPPVGPRRFRAPGKSQTWNGTRDALPPSPECLQLHEGQVHGQEDCLYLNVYSPQIPRKGKVLPVMVWIHGGEFTYDTGSMYGPRYLLDQDVVLVTLNYRLGPLGFLSTGDGASPGNFGMKDQVLALRWVQDNILAFGGDKNVVTIFGQSAGAASVGLHVVSPLSRGLFHRVIADSGGALCFWADNRNVTAASREIAQLLQCPPNSPRDMVECLRQVPADTLAAVPSQLVQWYNFPARIFAPTEEPEGPGAFLTKSPEQYYLNGEAANVPLLTGLTTNEMGGSVSAFIHNPVVVGDINRDWDRVGVIMLGLQSNTTQVKVEQARKTWEYFMGDKKLEWATRQQFAKLLSSRTYNEGVLQGVRVHSLYTKQPVYAYRFSYEGQYSRVEHFGGRPEDWEASHMDELIYLLNNPTLYGSLNYGGLPEDLLVSALMTRLWVNFATYGDPNGRFKGRRGSRRRSWQPVKPATDRLSRIRVFDIDLTPKMIPDPFEDEYRFWRLTINPQP